MYNRAQVSFKAGGEMKYSFQVRDGGVYPQCCFKSPEMDGWSLLIFQEQFSK